jgi:hypothetical protein
MVHRFRCGAGAVLFRRHFHGLVCRGWCSLVDAGFSGRGVLVMCEYSSSGCRVSFGGSGAGIGWESRLVV